MDKMVLVFEASLFQHLGEFKGYTLEVERYLPRLLNPANNFFLERNSPERDLRYRQLIPYVFFASATSLSSILPAKS